MLYAKAPRSILDAFVLTAGYMLHVLNERAEKERQKSYSMAENSRRMQALSIPDGLAPVAVNARSLEQSLLNMARNARDAITGGQGEITTKDTGTGLGMAVVFGLVHQVGGAIEVTSALGAGTKLSMYLPIANLALDAEPLDGAPVQPDATKENSSEPDIRARIKGSILVAEDRQDARRMVSRALLARSPVASIDRGHQHHDRIHLTATATNVCLLRCSPS